MLQRFDQLSEVFQKTKYTDAHKELSPSDALSQAIEMLKGVKGIVYCIGNGASGDIASHFSAELMKNCHLASQTLFNTSLFTSIANDLGYEHTFSHPLEKLLKPDDLLIALSGSGKSKNVLRALEVALKIRCPIMTFSGCEWENPLRQKGHWNAWIDCKEHGMIETLHFFLFHAIIDLWK